MPSLNDYIDFIVTLDFSNAQIIITDTSAYPPGVNVGINGVISITQPDGITRYGNWDTPDVTWNGSALPPASLELRTTAQNTPQCGTYIITYFITHPDYTLGSLTKSFVINITYPELVVTDHFDVFTPLLTLSDDTNYQLSGFEGPTVTRNWYIQVGGVTAIISTAQNVDLAYLGSYYDAVYTIEFDGSATALHSTYDYLTVIYDLGFNTTKTADTPPSINDLVQCLTDLKVLVDDQTDANCCSNLENTYAKAERRFSHLIHTLRVAETTGAYDLLTEFINLTTCAHGVNRNNPILPYDLSPYTGGGSDGDYYNYFLPSDATEVELSALNGKIIKAIDMDGFGRVFSVGLDTDVPDLGKFIVVNATPKKFKYGGTMFAGQWLRIKYVNS